MQGFTALAAGVFGCLVIVVWCQQPDVAQVAVVKGNNAFSAKLYKELSQQPGNVFFSPLSVEVVLALAWLGAKGETATQIAAGLHLPPTREHVEKGFQALMTHLLSNKNPNITLDIANKIYIQKDFKIREEFQKSAKQHFLSEAQEVDFQTNIEVSRTTINTWVEEKTRNKIKDFIAKDTIDASTVMILVNAIYFKGNWIKPFNKIQTKMAPFYVDAKTMNNVEMMHKTDYFKYADLPDLNAKVLQLDYSNKELSMLVLLPNENEGLPNLEAKLEGLDLLRVVDSLDNREVIVSLPKFKLEKSIDLNNVLQRLGMTSMFQNSANFSGLAIKEVKVSKVMQKSFVEVNEEGSEAAAATGLQIVGASVDVNPSPTPVFKADHPFVFIIKENTSGSLLFLGRFMKPLN